jgi:RimJ/RimL family protein N-acetyltransferase
MLVIGDYVVQWVAKRTNEYGNFGASQAIGWERGGELVAGVVYAEYNGVNIVCHIASDGSKQWLTREYLRTIFDFPFIQLRVNRITVCIGEGNSASRRFVEHLGFEREARLTGAHPTGDLLVYRMQKGACRWIHQDYLKRYAKTA